MSDKATDKKLYEALAAIFEYPQADYPAKVNRCVRTVRARGGRAAGHLLKLERYVRATSIEKLQETYTTTFDLNPVCALEIGFYVFGESYQRGVLLAGLNRMARENGIPVNGQLPDHLNVLLRLIARLKPEDEDYGALVELVMVPALSRMNRSFEGNPNVFGEALRAVETILREESGLVDKEPAAKIDHLFFGDRPGGSFFPAGEEMSGGPAGSGCAGCGPAAGNPAALSAEREATG